jgi:hypothetical protein
VRSNCSWQPTAEGSRLNAKVTLLPSARRLISSLREVGYDLSAALADIVDNSIAAGASKIDLRFVFDGTDSIISIADDAPGMTASGLDEAMRYGTERSYEVGELGRFGLGLKTASLSQCRRLTVATRHGRERRRIEIRRWDLDHVARSNRWEVLRVRATDAPEELVGPLRERPGTVVLWEGLDRILEYNLPNGSAARQGFTTAADEARAHLEMVFHRFLSGESRGRVCIAMNGRALSAWDPFVRAEAHTRALTPQRVGLPETMGGGTLLVRPFLLPPQERFSTAAAHVRASGPRRWNHQQGLYIYRNDRLIQAGGWNRLRTLDEHTKLARVAVDLPSGTDEVFRVNVAKMRMSLPREVRGDLMAIVNGVAAQAASRYRAGTGRRSSSVARAESDHGVAEIPAVLQLGDAHRIVLLLAVQVARDEFRQEPDILRRFLSRMDRLRADELNATLSTAASEGEVSILARSSARSSAKRT